MSRPQTAYLTDGPRRHTRSRPRAIFFVLAMVLCSLPLGGCRSDGYLTVRRVPHNPLAGPLQLLSRKGPQPTDRTEQLLRRYDLLTQQKTEPRQVLEKLQQEIFAEPAPEKAYALAELAYIQGKKAEALQNQDLAVDMYAMAVAHSYLYLFDSNFDQLRNPYDPQFRGACDLYNGSLEAALRIVNRRGRLVPGQTESVEIGPNRLEVTVVTRGPWRAEDIERLEFVSDYEIAGLTNHHHTYGLGVPLIAVRSSRPEEDQRYYPPGLSFPVTAFLRVLPHDTQAASPDGAVRRCVLELYDPLASSNLQIAQRLIPLQTDISTPLAYFLDNPAFSEKSASLATWGLINPNATQDMQGLYMLEPYDPQKIPVLMVHGLWSSPLTWMEMFNDLRSYPEIRDHYQFWFYLYPTGQPFWVSALQLREDLGEMRAAVDPQRQVAALDQMVLVGHSMGGLVCKLQTLESGQAFWKIVSDRPFEELEADVEDREKLAQTLFFQPNPSIRRVITIGTPHRGSEFANDYTRWLGRKLITLPAAMVQTSHSVIRDNPDFFRDTELLTITTSIDSLAPDSPILPVMLAAPRAPWVQYHNIVGTVPEEGIFGRLSAGSDGVVAFASAHLEDVQSELVVQADHVTVHQHPRTILEVRRILRDHLQSLYQQSHPVMPVAGEMSLAP